MCYAYDEKYIDDAMRNLGEAFDYAYNYCGIQLDEFMDMFITSGIASQFEDGNPKFVSGMSGIELVWDVVSRTGKKLDMPEQLVEYEHSREYWSGWILAYYQWNTGRSFENIRKYISIKEILKLYPTLHEASEEKFVDTINVIIERIKT